MAAEIMSKNISETLRSVDTKQPVISTLSQKGNFELVQQFLSENIHVGAEEKETAERQLYIACFWGLFDVVKSLVESGTDVNSRNENSLWSPLHAATFQENGKVIMYLLQHDADTEIQDSEGRTPTDFASVSDKIWPLFAARRCTRTPKQVLYEKKILDRKTPNPIQSDVKDIASLRNIDSTCLIDYRNTSNKNPVGNERDAYSASVDGDVLAAENYKATTDNQPNFHIWRT